MRVLVLLVLFISQASLACTNKDSWTGPDKRKHFLAGAAIGSAGTLVFKDPRKGFLLGVAAGALKEAYDSRGNGTCSFQDFATTTLGSAVGSYGTAWVVLPKKNGLFVGYATRF